MGVLVFEVFFGFDLYENAGADRVYFELRKTSREYLACLER
jgi:hypothetical protein